MVLSNKISKIFSIRLLMVFLSAVSTLKIYAMLGIGDFADKYFIILTVAAFAPSVVNIAFRSTLIPIIVSQSSSKSSNALSLGLNITTPWLQSFLLMTAISLAVALVLQALGLQIYALAMVTLCVSLVLLSIEIVNSILNAAKIFIIGQIAELVRVVTFLLMLVTFSSEINSVFALALLLLASHLTSLILIPIVVYKKLDKRYKTVKNIKQLRSNVISINGDWSAIFPAFVPLFINSAAMHMGSGTLATLGYVSRLAVPFILGVNAVNSVFFSYVNTFSEF